ncbi:MAG TPA: hypothetical protein VHR55_07155 [Candidatus Limnocylindria bacterium]|nr:hypothetical protein [Candidatus Limnocylindria bacterium]
MDVGQLAFLAVAMALMAFTLGASVAVRLEGRRPLTLPPWLAVTRGVTFLVWTLFIVVTVDPPSGVIAIDALWWNALKAVLLLLAVVALPLEVREARRRRTA